MASYLVTGGCGFIGSHLADALVAAGHRIRILDDLSTGRRENAPAEAEIVIGDIADAATVARAMDGMDGAFHLAAIASVARSNEDWAGTHRVNATGTVNVLDSARTARDGRPAPVVYISSAAVYGDSQDVPLAETAAARPLTAYGADKLASELHGRVAWAVHRVPTVGFRFFNIYGPRQDPESPYSGVISIFADRIRAGQGVTIFGDGEQSRDFVFVADAVRFVMRGMALAEQGEGAAVFNVCTGRETTVNRLAAVLCEIAGRMAPIGFGPARSGDIRRSLGDPAAAAVALGVTADTGIEDGLAETLGSLVDG
ncbi:MAG: NAD-dependent epimerase/dehydratase family protein [Alphaproteobacteria bacterium]|nr:NAD-dependent epimerase/dehydratase family protein [Alphaproteobacteria bacterium]